MTNPFVDLAPDEYDALLEDIERRGMVYPVIRDQSGRTIDGHQRERVCTALGIEPHYRVVICASDTEREALAVVLNTHRRHLTPQQRREAIVRLAPTGMTQAEIGAAVGVSHQRVSQVVAGLQELETPAPEPLTDKQGRPPEQRGGRPRNAPQEAAPEEAAMWEGLLQLMDALEAFTDAKRVAATIPDRRRAATARRLRKLGTYLARIALVIEREGEPS